MLGNRKEMASRAFEPLNPGAVQANPEQTACRLYREAEGDGLEKEKKHVSDTKDSD